MFTQLIRIGRDAEVRYTPGGRAVTSAVGAYDIGWGDNKRTQWIDCVIWGDRAEKIGPHIIKGQQFMVTLDDVEVETFQGNDGTTKTKLKGRVIDIKFCGPKPEHKYARTPQQQQPSQSFQQPRDSSAEGRGPDDFSDDIPF